MPSIGRDVAKILEPVFAWRLNSSFMNRERTPSVVEHSSRPSITIKALEKLAMTEYNASETLSKQSIVSGMIFHDCFLAQCCDTLREKGLSLGKLL